MKNQISDVLRALLLEHNKLQLQVIKGHLSADKAPLSLQEMIDRYTYQLMSIEHEELVDWHNLSEGTIIEVKFGDKWILAKYHHFDHTTNKVAARTPHGIKYFKEYRLPMGVRACSV